MARIVRPARLVNTSVINRKKVADADVMQREYIKNI